MTRSKAVSRRRGQPELFRDRGNDPLRRRLDFCITGTCKAKSHGDVSGIREARFQPSASGFGRLDSTMKWSNTCKSGRGGFGFGFDVHAAIQSHVIPRSMDPTSSLPGEKRPGGGPGFSGDFASGEHSRKFIDPLLRIEPGDIDRCAAAPGFDIEL